MIEFPLTKKRDLARLEILEAIGASHLDDYAHEALFNRISDDEADHWLAGTHTRQQPEPINA